MFFPLLFILLEGLQLMLFLKANHWLRERHPRLHAARWLLLGLFVVFNGGMAVVLFLRPSVRGIPTWMLQTLLPPFYIWHGATLMLGIFLLCGILVSLPFRGLFMMLRQLPWTRAKMDAVSATAGVQRFDASRRVFLRRSMYGLTAASFGSATYGVLDGRLAYEFTATTFVIPRLSHGLDGFTIALLSDVHSSPFMSKAEMDEYARVLRALNTDMIVIPGDFITSRTEEVYPFAEAFQGLHAPCGVYGVMGNHDFFAPNPERVARTVDDCGVKLLRNDRVIIDKNGAGMALLGVDDTGRTERAAFLMRTAARDLPPEIPRILLCHRPYFLEQAAAEGIDIVLSGHTHGGQIVFGRFGSTTFTPARIASPYVWGRYHWGNTQMYVSRGIGTVGLPMRINCPPEITTITLTRG